MAAIAGEVRVIVRERMSVFAKIVFKSTLWLCRLQISRTHYRLIGSLQRAFAVPSIAWVMLVPERIIDGERELHAPVGSVCASITAESYSVLSYAPILCTLKAANTSLECRRF